MKIIIVLEPHPASIDPTSGAFNDFVWNAHAAGAVSMHASGNTPYNALHELGGRINKALIVAAIHAFVEKETT